MKRSHLIPFLIIPFLFSCFPKKPEIPRFGVPHEGLVQALEERIRSFSSLKALASMQVARKSRKRTFDSVGVLVNGRDQFYIEAYGPLGQNLVRLLWDGKVLALDLGGDRRVIPGSGGLEQIFGTRLDPAELCAVLSGNVPLNAAGSEAQFLCSTAGDCVFELRKDDTTVRMGLDADWAAKRMPVGPYEVFHNGKPAYAVWFASYAEVSGYLLPRNIIVENSEKKVSLTIEYTEAEVNAPLDTRIFSFPEAGDQ